MTHSFCCCSSLFCLACQSTLCALLLSHIPSIQYCCLVMHYGHLNVRNYANVLGDMAGSKLLALLA